MKLMSNSFKEEQRIPEDFTCEGQNLSPALTWSGAPDGVKSFAIVCADPDAPAGTWYHWAIFDIPASATKLPQAVPDSPGIGGARQAVNDFEQVGYGGPCPPRGHGDHRYFFTLYALKVAELGLGERPGCREVEEKAASSALQKAQLMGTYSRE